LLFNIWFHHRSFIFRTIFHQGYHLSVESLKALCSLHTSCTWNGFGLKDTDTDTDAVADTDTKVHLPLVATHTRFVDPRLQWYRNSWKVFIDFRIDFRLADHCVSNGFLDKKSSSCLAVTFLGDWGVPIINQTLNLATCFGQ